ncbi:uncharacterized protein LOC123558776 [Mercenaria mercenaria]|uniref:uncharacterized protein LOC123558776 n=1 Tax=Mercenaria mercenaria TaxID=6596 RepID=UPI00234E9044|nr:uncharacterized protein LOC123558776 [Mercenaria mercenaria]
MASCRKHFKSASSTLKIATVLLILTFVLHVVAFSTPNWSTVRLSVENASYFWLEGSDHAGLWQVCSCFEHGFCTCFGRHGDPVLFKVVQTLETFALVGYIISGILSLVQLFSEQDRKVKKINVFIIVGAGLCAALGVIVFGIRSRNEFKDMVEFLDQLGLDYDGHLDYSFYFCCISVFFCLIMCTPLYMKDEKIPVPTVTQELPVVYNNQGQMVIPSHIQEHVYASDMDQPSLENIPTIAHAPYGAPPAYTAANQQVPPPQFDDGIPYKA